MNTFSAFLKSNRRTIHFNIVVILLLSFTNIFAFETDVTNTGVIDVTTYPYNADNTGKTICTQIIRNAIRDAQEQKKACYFPSGTYLVDDSISAVMRCIKFGDGTKCEQDRLKPVYLLGATNPRPIIKLADAVAIGYQSSVTPKPIFWLWAQNRDITTRPIADPDPNTEQSDINFNMVIRNFEINLNGYPGAIGIQFAGAQGSTIEDIKIDASKGGFAGISGCPGHAGGCYNIEVLGGKHAFYFPNNHEYGNGKFPTLVGITCTNQSDEVFKVGLMSFPMVVVGFHIVKRSGNLINKLTDRGGMSMIDGIIEYTNSYAQAQAIDIAAIANNLYLKNVYIKKCTNLITTGQGNSALAANDWKRIKEYKFTKNDRGLNLIDGTSTSSFGVMNLETAAPPDPTELIRKHTWDPLTFVSFEMMNDEDFVNVLDASKMTGTAGAALGNGIKNDTEAIQWAIDNFKKVFIPKGTFMIDKPLKLKSHTQLTGIGKVYSTIKAMSSWASGAPKTMITTVDDKEATTSISFVKLENSYLEHRDLNKITWQAGRNSIIRDIMVDQDFAWGPNNSLNCVDHKMFIFTGSAGGRVYALGAEYNAFRDLTFHPNYRHILIEGTTEPMRFYSCNVERVHGGVQFEIKNSSNIDIFYLKSEAAVTGSDDDKKVGDSTPLLINNSSNIGVYSLGGFLNLKPGQALLELTNNSTGIIATHFKSNASTLTSGWFNLKETFNYQVFSVGYDVNLGLFSRNYIFNTGIATPDVNSFGIYPNPARSFIYFDNIENSNKRFVVRQLSGTKVYESKLGIGKVAVNINFLPNGMYFTQLITDDGKTLSSKFIKE